MKMQKATPTCSRWMTNSFLGDDTNTDEDDDNRFGTVDSVGAYTQGETDTDTCGPYSVTSCPPSVGPDQDAFLQTPSMYAPTSPLCATSPSCGDTGRNHPTGDVHHVVPVKKMDLMNERVTRLQADPHPTNVGNGCIISGREDIQKAGFTRLDNDVRYTVPKLKADYEDFIPIAAMLSSFQKLENVHDKQSVQTEPLDQRRMSLDEFIESVPEEQLILSLQDESHMSPRGEGHTQIESYEAAISRNSKTPEQSKTTKRARKRPANGLIFSNSDFSSFDNEIPVKRQMVVASQRHLVPNFKDGQMYYAGSIADEMCGRTGLAPRVRNSDSKKKRSTSAGQNPTYGSPVSFTASLRPDTGQFGQAVQDPQTSSLAAATPTIFMLDNNGNVVATDSQTPDSHINPCVVDPNPNHNQHKACTACNEQTSLQPQQHMTPFIECTLPDNTTVSVPLEAILDFLQKAATSTPSSPQQITHKPPDFHVSAMTSTGAQNGSSIINSNITHDIKLARQETASLLDPSPTGLLYQNLQPSCTRPPDIGACNRESTTSATTTTSSHDAFSFNDIRQPQETGRKSHLFNPSASTDPFTASTDPFTASTDPFTASTGLFPDAADPHLEEYNNSGISCLPADAITAQMLIKSSTDGTSLYHTPTFSHIKSAPETTANTNVLIASDDFIESLPGNSLFGTASASVYGYHSNDILEDPQERSNTDPGTSCWGSVTHDEMIQERSGVVESTHILNIHATATDRQDIINGIPSQTKYGSHSTITAADLTADTASALESYLISPSPGGHTDANGDTDYLIETNVEHLSAIRSYADDSHFAATIPQNRVCDLFLDAASQDSETMFACDASRNFLNDAASSVADSGSTTVDPSGVTDSALVGALRKSAETAQTSDFVKQGLKYAILTKRQMEGKADLDISFQPGGPHELTEEEQKKELRRKELNKTAARNHRQKKKTSKETQDKEYEEMVKKNSQLKEEVARLKYAIEHFRKLLQAQRIPCLEL